MDKRCYGVDVSYPNQPHYKDIERRDAEIMRAVRRAVPRIKELPDGGFGMGRRDLQFDAVSYGAGFTRKEAEAIAHAARSVGADGHIRDTDCKLKP